MAGSTLPPSVASHGREARVCSTALAPGCVPRCQPDSSAGGQCVGGVEQQGELQPAGGEEGSGEGHGSTVETPGVDS